MSQLPKNNFNYSHISPIMFCFFVMGFVDVLGVATSYVKHSFLLSDTVANFLPMITLMWFLLISLPIGMLINQIGRKNMVMLSLLVTFVAVLLPFIGYSFGCVLVAFALLGIGNTILQVSLGPLVTNIVDPSRLSSVLTFGQFVKSVSSALAPILIGIAATYFYDWRLVFVLYAVICIISVSWLRFSVIPRERVILKQDNKKILLMFKDHYIQSLFLIILLIVGFEIGLNTAIPKYFTEHFGAELMTGSKACSLFFVAKMIGTFLGAFLLFRIPSGFFLSIITGLATLSMILFMCVNNLHGAQVLLFLLGLFTANVYSVTLSKAFQYCLGSSNEASALMVMGVSGGALLPVIMGIVADYSSQWNSLFVLLLAVIIVFFFSLLSVKK